MLTINKNSFYTIHYRLPCILMKVTNYMKKNREKILQPHFLDEETESKRPTISAKVTKLVSSEAEYKQIFPDS